MWNSSINSIQLFSPKGGYFQTNLRISSSSSTSFSEVGDYIVSQFFTLDNRNETTDFQIYTLNGITVGIEHDLLSEALRVLPERKREILVFVN